MKILPLSTTFIGALVLLARPGLSVGCSCGAVKPCNALDSSGYCCNGVKRQVHYDVI